MKSFISVLCKFHMVAKKKAFVVGTNVSAISQLLNSFEEYYAYDVAWIKTSPIWILAYVGGNSLIGSTEIMSQKNQPNDEKMTTK